MTDNPNVGLEGAGGNQLPVSPKPIEEAPKSSQELLSLQKSLELLTKEVKGLQSRQDKSTNEVQRFMDEVRAKVANGMTLEDAEKSVHADRKAAEEKELLYKIAAKVGVDAPSAQAAGNGPSVTDETAKAIEALKLDPNDPEVAIALREGGGVLRLAEIAVKNANKPTPSPTGAPALGSAPAPTMTNERIEQLAAERNALYKEPSKNRAKIKAIEKQLTEAGVPID